MLLGMSLCKLSHRSIRILHPTLRQPVRCGIQTTLANPPFSHHRRVLVPARAAMSTLELTTTVNDEKLTLPVHLKLPSSEKLSLAELLAFSPFRTWLSNIHRSLALQSQPSHPFHSSPYTLSSISITSVTRFGSKIGFLTLNAAVHTKTYESSAGVPLKSETLPGSMLLRGPAVAMLVILQPDDVERNSETDKHVLLTVQPRIPAGSLAMVELPAGMVDDGTFKGAASREIEEECGLTIDDDELVDLTALASDMPPLISSRGPGEQSEPRREEERLHKATYTSCGGQDEAVAIFMHQRQVPRGQLSEWTGRLTGLRDEGEKITLKCVRLENLWREAPRDSKALAAWALYEGLRREGKI